VIELVVPSLRERRDEIPTLTDSFVSKYARKYKRAAPRISPELRQLFLQYEWPGNIRELENMIKRLVILQDEQLVFTEIERNVRRVVGGAATVPVALPAAAGVAVGAGVPAAVCGGVAAPVGVLTAPPVFADPAPEPADPDAPEPAADDAGGSLASVAKAAAMKAERAVIEKTLRQVHWNRRKTAQILGVSYKTLLNKIKECGINRD